MTISDLHLKLALSTVALEHATKRVEENPGNQEAKAIKATLRLRCGVLTHEIKKQEGIAALCTK